MEKRSLGNGGLTVAALSLGCMGYGKARELQDRTQMIALIRKSVERGIDFFDTAESYGPLTNEDMVGEALMPLRDQVKIATKFGWDIDPDTGVHHGGVNSKPVHIKAAVDGSLRRLKTDYIDLYWLHIWDQITPVEEVMRAFDDLVRQGKVLYVGVSDAPAWWISRANTIAELRGWSPFVGLQIEYSLIERTIERELLPAAKALGLTITAWSPLAGGVLTGKYASGEAKDSRYSTEMMKQWLPEQTRAARIVDALQNVSKQTGCSKAQIALAWLLHRSVPVIPIVGARKLTQLEDNIASLTLSLTPDQLASLDEASKIELGFPHHFYAQEMVRNFVYAGFGDRIIL